IMAMPATHRELHAWPGHSGQFDPSLAAPTFGQPRSTSAGPALGWSGGWSAPPLRPAPLAGAAVRPFGGYLQRRKRHWIRRFLLAVIAFGAAAHFTRGYVPAFERGEQQVREAVLRWTATPRAVVDDLRGKTVTTKVG